MCQQRYDLPQELLTAAVGDLRKAGRIVLDGEAVYLLGLYLAERAVPVPSGPWRPALGSVGSSTLRPPWTGPAAGWAWS